ncbi:MAG: MerR family transcriptional regulator [Candidatus Omnitrophica bacterium]|nr:MerR family transcriptional regulator [Candidatus Omnitrophota bacterium]
MVMFRLTMNKTGLVTMQEITRFTGVSFSALNYYVNLGMLPVADRQGNKRLFSKGTALRRLKEIQRMKREGYPLRIILRHLQEKQQASR